MGDIANAIVSYAQPLMDQTDGSTDELNKALGVSQACWNIAILPKEKREFAINKFGEVFRLSDSEFEAFKRDIAVPMIRRHEEMFPHLHEKRSFDQARASSPSIPATKTKGTKTLAESMEPGRYAPCPCNSGKKYKFCCGKPSRAS